MTLNLQSLTPRSGLQQLITLKTPMRPQVEQASDQFWSALRDTLRTAGFEYLSPDEYGLLAARPGLWVTDATEQPHFAFHLTYNAFDGIQVSCKVIGVPGLGEKEFPSGQILRTLGLESNTIHTLQKLAMQLCMTLRLPDYSIPLPRHYGETLTLTEIQQALEP